MILLLAADLLATDALGVGQVTVGGIGLVVFTKFVFQLGSIKKTVDTFLASLTATLEAHNGHVKDAKRHHEVMEATQQQQVDIMGRLELALSSTPRAVTGDHTPVPVSVHPPGE